MIAGTTGLAAALSIPASASSDIPARQAASAPAASAVTAATYGSRAAAPPPTRAQLATLARRHDEAVASAQARKAHKPVVVESATDTGTLLTANPDGSFTLTETSQPVRVKQHGTWVPIDPSLVRAADGTLRTVATTTAISFSGGGPGPMASIASGADRLSFAFPAALPTPVISGSQATYREVLPGVDLRLTANASGFSQLLVVKDRAAAASPALHALRFGMSAQGVKVSQDPGGGATATDTSGSTVFHADTATMWDSAALQATPQAAPPAAGPAASPALHPAAAALPGRHMARVSVRADATSETIAPDPAMLASPSTVFPLYIDPDWAGNPSQLKWARISSTCADGSGQVWSVYNSTSTDPTQRARSGLDTWTGGCGETARTYYQMNSSGLNGVRVMIATLNVVDTWSAFSADTAADVYSTAPPQNNTWNSANLNWSTQPYNGPKTLQDNAVSHESGTTVVPSTLQFNVTQGARTVANSNGDYLTLALVSHSETDHDYWKQYGTGGGASMTTTFFEPPVLAGGTGSPSITPSVTDSGTTYVTSHTPTLTITGQLGPTEIADGKTESLRNDYQIFNYANGTLGSQIGVDLVTAYTTASAGGGSATYGGSLADGTYAWQGRTQNFGAGTGNDGSYQYYSDWSQLMVFTVDTTPPPAPAVESPQFPAGAFGAAYSDAGSVTITTSSSGNNIKGYIVSLDGDLSSTVYSAGLPAWTSTPTVGTAYWVPASTTSNGTTVSLTPGVVGPHRLYVKAVDHAHLTAATSMTTYSFFAEFTTPSYVTGSQLTHGYTAGDGTVVPAGTAVTSGQLISQPDCCGIHWMDGHQAQLNGASTVQAGDSMTLSFEVPTAGYYDLGANLTKAADYGAFAISLNANASTGTSAYALASSYDAYNSTVTTSFADFGVPKNADGSPMNLPQGVYSVTLTITGHNGSSSGYQAGIDFLRLELMSSTCSITSLSGCYNNTAITNAGNTANGDADGYGNSLPADMLHTVGWDPGTAITVDGAPMTLPGYAASGTGKVADNILAEGQTISIPATGYANDGNAVEFLAFGTDGSVASASGVIKYAQPNLCNQGADQSYILNQVPDWVSGNPVAAAETFPGRNDQGTADDTSAPVHVYAVSVPLACPGQAIASIQLPVVYNGAKGKNLHILAVGIRNASYTDSSNAQNWAATFAATQDSLASISQTTIRMSAATSVAGTSLRIHLSNLVPGSTKVTFDHVTVAAAPAGAPSPVPVTGTMTAVKFNGGSASVTIPGSGEVVSDPVPFTTTTGGQTLLVSAHMTGSVTSASEHSHARATSWTSTSTADLAADASGTTFTQPTTDLPYLTGIDVTSDGNTTGSVGFWGDQTINSDTSSGAPSRFTDDVIVDVASLNSGSVPYGVLNLGHYGTLAQNTMFAPSVNPLPQSANDPVDADALDRANLRTVLVSSGTQDILAGASAVTVGNDLKSIVSEIKNTTADTFGNNISGFITVDVATIPPNASFTAAQESVREAVNASICGAAAIGGSCGDGVYLDQIADGYVDFAAAVSGGTAFTTTVAAANLNANGTPNNNYYRAEATAFTGAAAASGSSSSGDLPIKPNVIRLP
jgi:hypothetical protein